MATVSSKSGSDSPPLQILAQRLKAWRATRTPGQRIPEKLWKAAARLARIHGLSRTATALKLAYYDLQRRVSGAGRQRRRALRPAPFVQLAPPSWSAGAAESGTLELTLASGGRLTLRLPNASAKELGPLVQLVLRHRR
jgi:hypothetical protein